MCSDFHDEKDWPKNKRNPFEGSKGFIATASYTGANANIYEKVEVPKKDELRILKIYLGYLATVFSIIAAAYFFGG